MVVTAKYLISIEALAKHNMSLLFEQDSTSIFFSSTIELLHDKPMQAIIYNRLSFLYCNFILLNAIDIIMVTSDVFF